MKYVKEDVENMLKHHKENESKLTEIELKLEEYQERLDYAGTVYEDTAEEIIESMQLAGQANDVIHSNTNKIIDKVINTAINYNKEIARVNREDRSFLERKIETLKKDREELNKKIVRVINMIEPLSQEQKFVIQTYYMQKLKWDYIEKEYFREFEKYKSIKQLQRHRDNAIECMIKIVNTGI